MRTSLVLQIWVLNVIKLNCVIKLFKINLPAFNFHLLRNSSNLLSASFTDFKIIALKCL